MRDHGLGEPVFENRRDEFIVTLYNGSSAAIKDDHGEMMDTAGLKSKEISDRIAEFCTTPRSRQEIADMLGIKTVFYVTQRYIMPLIENGMLKMTIP